MSATEKKPDLNQTTIHQWLTEHYTLTGSLQLLPGERDLNFKLTSDQGKAYVCKVCDNAEDLDFLSAQHEVLTHLEGHALSAIPQVVPTTNGQSLVQARSDDGQTFVLRVLTYVPGDVLAKREPYSAALLHDLGQTVGRMAQALNGFDHPAFHYAFDWDLAHGPSVIERYGKLIADPQVRDAVQQIGQEFTGTVTPLLRSLPKSVIHNDANDYNVLAQEDKVTGLIDFGDMVYTCTICDLAIAMAYATLGSEDAMQTILTMAAGYQAVRPIVPDERAVLLPMVRMRLAISACMSAHQTQQRPDDPYLAISQEPIRKTLPKLMALGLNDVHQQLNEELA